MQEPTLPSNEVERLQALKLLAILDSVREKEFDDIVRLAALACGTRYAAVSLIDSGRQWFKAFEGAQDIHEHPRSISFCAHAINEADIFEVADTLLDTRFFDNPLVTEAPYLRFYAGVPLVLASGFTVGTLCCLGVEPKTLNSTQREQLRLLGRQVVSLLEARHLNKTRLRLNQFIDCSSVMVAMVDINARLISYANQSWLARCGRGPGAPLSALQSLLPELDMSLFEGGDKALHGPIILAGLTISYTENKRSWANVQLFPDNTNDAERRFPPQLLLVIEDHSEADPSREQAREARKKAQLLERVAAITSNPVIITDAARRILWVNTSFERTTGYKAEEVAGRNPSFLQGSKTNPDSIQRIRTALREGKGIVQEVLNYAKDGNTYWIELDIQPIRNDDGTTSHYVAVQTDITRRQRQQQEVLRARDEAERASRLKSQFLATVSHELRTPLNGILGISEYLDRSAPPEFKADLNTLHRSAQHLLGLLNEMIDLSAIEMGTFSFHKEPFSIALVANSVIDLFRANADIKGLQLNLEIDDLASKSWAVGDARRLSQILMNLVGNAVKFTRQGQVLLTCRAVAVDSLQWLLEFSVKDTGPGITDYDKAHIFQPFERSNSPQAGAGLGLAISQQLLARMESVLTLDTHLGQGSQFGFTLRLPRVEAPLKSGDTLMIEQIKVPRQVLVLDDNPTNLQVLHGMLKTLGVVDIRLWSDSRQALKDWRNLAPDAVFVDLLMPDFDGLEFIKEYRRATLDDSRVKPLLIACTALTSKEDRAACLEGGFDVHLEKPVSMDALAGILQIPPGASRQDRQIAIYPGSVVTRSLNEKLGNNPKLIQKFLTNLRKQHATVRAGLLKALAEQDLLAVKTTAHILKGQLGYFGTGHSVYRALLALGANLNGETGQFPSEQIEDLLEEMETLNRQVQEFLAEQSENENNGVF